MTTNGHDPSAAAYIVEAACTACLVPYYRSVRPLVLGRDRLTPELFAPIDPDTPPPNPDRPTCPSCGELLRFVKVAGSAVPGAAAPRTETDGMTTLPPAPPALPCLTVLFEVGDDEHVLEIKDVGNAYLVVTNRRICLLRYADLGVSVS